MKLTVVITIAFLGLFSRGFSQQNPDWQKWSGLIGEWVGEGSGTPGHGEGTFSFKLDLDQKILVRKSHSEYPGRGNNSELVHNDLMIVYPDYSGNPAKAIYFDNEGHTISYTVTYPEKAIVLTGEKIPGVPVFRLTYTFPGTDIVNTKFEMSKDGEKFTTYIEGNSRKAN